MGTNMPVTPARPRGVSSLNNSTETPHRLKQTSLFHGEDFHVDKSRTALVYDVGSSIPQVSWEHVVANVLPALHSNIELTAVVAALKASGDINPAGTWTAFRCDPAQDGRKEPDVFHSLAKVVSAIVKHSNVSDADQTTDYVSKPSHTPVCDYVEKASNPDGHMVFRTRQPDSHRDDGRRYWRDLCTPAEFKRLETDKDLEDVSPSCMPCRLLL